MNPDEAIVRAAEQIVASEYVTASLQFHAEKAIRPILEATIGRLGEHVDELYRRVDQLEKQGDHHE